MYWLFTAEYPSVGLIWFCETNILLFLEKLPPAITDSANLFVSSLPPPKFVFPLTIILLLGG